MDVIVHLSLFEKHIAGDRQVGGWSVMASEGQAVSVPVLLPAVSDASQTQLYDLVVKIERS